MPVTTQRRGSATIPEVAGSMPPTSRENLDRAVEELQGHRDEWAKLPVRERIALLEQLHADCGRVADGWVAIALQAKGITPGTPTEAEEWLAGPFFILRNLRLLRRSLGEIERRGRPKIPGRVTTLPNGQVAARVFPADIYDHVFFRGFSGDIWMEPGVTAEELPSTQAAAGHTGWSCWRSR